MAQEFVVDGTFVHTIDGIPVKEMMESDLLRYAVLFAERTQYLMDAHRAALFQLVKNEQQLTLVTHELNTRKRIVTS